MSKVVLLLRSGRHLQPAVDALRAAYPGYRLAVVTQPGTELELDRAGVDPRDRIVYYGRRFAALRFVFSRAALHVLSRWPARVAVLWNDDQGHGLANVTRTGWILGRGSIIPVTPQGALQPLSWWQPLRDRMVPLLARVAARWDALRTRVEGPELEPPFWHSHFLTGGPSARVMREMAAPLTGRVLDIGAGTGYARRFLNPETTRYLPTDLPTGRDAADDAISRQGSGPSVYCAGASLPFRDRSLDAVVSLSVLEHVVDVPGILRDAHRVLRPGGRVLISTPFYFPFHGEPDDYRRWTVHGLAAELRACGFEIEEVRRIGSSVTTLILNLHMVIKYEWRTARSPVLRFVSRWAWPLVLVWQGATNLLASAVERYEPESRMPLGVAVVARRPAGGHS